MNESTRTFTIRSYPLQLEKRNKEVIGMHKITDISCAIISPAVSRMMLTEPSRDSLFISFQYNSSETLLKLYIDPAIGVLKKNFKSEEVSKEIFLNDSILESLGLHDGQVITVTRIGNMEEIDVINRVILTKVQSTTSKKITLNKNYLREFVKQRTFFQHDSTLLIPTNVFDLNSECAQYRVSCKFLDGDTNSWGRITKQTPIILDFDGITPDKIQDSYWKGEQYSTVKSFFKHSLQSKSDTMKSFLIHGTGGSGKTSMIFNIAKDLNVNIKKLSPSSIYAKIYQEEEGVFNLQHQYNEALLLQPCLFVIDEIDILFPDEEESKDLLLVNQMLHIFKIIETTSSPVCLIGVTSNIDRLDPFIKQQFEEQIMVDVPNNEERLLIFTTLMHEQEIDCCGNTTREELLKEISDNHFHGMVQTDIAMLATRCSQRYNKRALQGNPTKLTKQDILEELKTIEPYSIRQASQTLTVPQIPKVDWKDIGGLSEVKEKLKEMIVWPLKHYESYVRMGIKPPSGLLLYGPPGTGKTLIAKAVASASSSNFISINIPDLIKAEVGESEKTLSEVFRRARLASPCVIFFDEIQAIFGDRTDSSSGEQRLISQLLLELDSLENSDFLNNKQAGCVVVIAATNVPHKIDPTALRPGRIEHILFVGPPDSEARKSIFEMTIKGMAVTEEVRAHIDDFVEATDKNYSGADIANICQRAGLNALSRNIHATERSKITLSDFAQAIEMVSPSLTKQQMSYFEEWELSRLEE